MLSKDPKGFSPKITFDKQQSRLGISGYLVVVYSVADGPNHTLVTRRGPETSLLQHEGQTGRHLRAIYGQYIRTKLCLRAGCEIQSIHQHTMAQIDQRHNSLRLIYFSNTAQDNHILQRINFVQINCTRLVYKVKETIQSCVSFLFMDRIADDQTS